MQVLGGVIDSDYRRPLFCILHNQNPSESFSLQTGRKYVQLLVLPYYNLKIRPYHVLNTTTRGEYAYTE